MQQGIIINLHLAPKSGTPVQKVPEITAISGNGLEGDRHCNPGNPLQVLLMDKETLDELKLEPGQIKENITTAGLDLSLTEVGQVFFIGDVVTMEIVRDARPCDRMNAIRPGLREELINRRGMLAMVINGGIIKVGDSIRVEP